MVSRDVAETAYIHPSNGSYRVTSAAADSSPTFPEDGRGAKTTTAGNAHWTDMGLAAGDFCAMVSLIVVPSGTYLTIVDVASGGTGTTFPGGSHSFNPPMRMEGGFGFQTALGSTPGGTILYQLHEYRQPTT